MRIGINALWLLPGMVGGAETHLRGLLSGLSRLDEDHDYVLFTNKDNHESFAGLGTNFSRRLFDFGARWDPWSLAMIRLVGEQIVLPWRSRGERLDVLHAPLDVAPLAAPCPLVLTIHDLNFSAVHETAAASARRLGEALVRVSARRADAVLTVSEFSRSQICRQLRLPAHKVRVVYNAPAARRSGPAPAWPRLRERLGIGQEYLLGLSSLNSHKNIPALIHAFSRLPSAGRRQLVICGHLPRLGPSLPMLARRLGVWGRVVFTGYLADQEMETVLENARALAFPSLYEGFGLPVVEAMAAGVPVACSTATCLPEIASEAALFFDPLDPRELANRLWRLLTDEPLRRRLIAAGRANALRFSWDAAARRTAEAYCLAASGLPVAPRALAPSGL